jgi:uncharacterized membrane protein
MRAVNLWLHVVAFSLFLGACGTLVLAVVPAIRAIEDPADRRRLFARVMRVYDPLAVGALGVSILTGAFNLTDYKARFGPRFASELGGVLAAKLVVVFLLVLVATGIAFGIGHRTVREELNDDPLDPEALAQRLTRLRSSLWIALALAGLAVAFGLALPR